MQNTKPLKQKSKPEERMAFILELLEQLEELELTMPGDLHALWALEPKFKTEGISSNAFALSGIVQTPGICGGVARINRSRIPVWTIERMRQLGASEDDLLSNFPTLSSIDLAQARLYTLINQREIESQIRENENDEE